MASGRAAFADTQTTGIQRDIVGQNDDMRRRDFIEPCGCLHRLAAEVHIGGGLQQHQLEAVEGRLPGETLKLDPVYLGTQIIGQRIQCGKANIVPGVPVFAAGIAQPDHQIIAAGGRFQQH